MNRPQEILASSVGFFLLYMWYFQQLTFSSIHRPLVAEIPKYLPSVSYRLALDQIFVKGSSVS